MAERRNYLDQWRKVSLGDAAGNNLAIQPDGSLNVNSTAGGIADDAAFTVGTSVVSPAGFLADETATDSVNEGDIGAARMTLDRKIHSVVTQESSEMRAGGVATTPLFAKISAASSGNNTIVAADATKKIRVLSYTLVAAAAVTAKFQTAAGGTDLTGAMPFGANGGVHAAYCPAGHFETVANQLLNLSLGGAVQVSGHLTYILV